MKIKKFMHSRMLTLKHQFIF